MAKLEVERRHLVMLLRMRSVEVESTNFGENKNVNNLFSLLHIIVLDKPTNPTNIWMRIILDIKMCLKR